MQHKTDRQRLPELDGLRGIAALLVFLGHVVAMLPASLFVDFIRQKPILAFYGGHSPVYLFFVLSGFVLSLPFLQGGRLPNYPSFVVQRVFRIYPAFWAAILFSLACMIFYRPADMAGLSDWARSFWHGGIAAIPLPQLAKTFSLVIGFDEKFTDPPSWSLLVEMRMSLLVPVMIAILRLHRSRWIAAGLLALTALISNIVVLTFLPMFCLGVVLARYWHVLLPWMMARSRLQAGLLSVVALCLYAVPFMPAFSESPVLAPNFTALGSALMIVIVSSRERARYWLTGKITGFFGRISYSFYLFHFPVMLLCFSLLYARFGGLVAIVATMAITTAISAASLQLIELPFIRVGKAVLGYRSRRRAALAFPVPLPTVPLALGRDEP